MTILFSTTKPASPACQLPARIYFVAPDDALLARVTEKVAELMGRHLSYIFHDEAPGGVTPIILEDVGPSTQPVPSAAVALGDDLRDGLVAISKAVADQDDRAAQAMLKEILAAPQPSPTHQADSAPAEAVQRIVHLRADRERRVYVAGPMTGLPEYNFPMFNATAARLRSEGWHVENPAEHGHVDGAGWSDYLRWDISRIATRGAIYLLPGWSKSKGATLEVHIAGVLGLQVLLADGKEE